MGADCSEELRRAARRVFVSGDPYRPEFAPETAAHTLLAPTPQSMLDRTQFHAIGQAHAAEGGGPVYVTVIPDQLDRPWRTENRCYEIDFSNSQTYFSDDFRAYMTVENLIAPLNGSWAVLIADFGYAVVAGSRAFVDAVLEGVTLDADEMALLFMRMWKEYAEIGLPHPNLDAFLETMYGRTEAARLAAD